MANKNKYDNRRSNIPNSSTAHKNNVTKVNNGVFVYSHEMSVSELAKQLSISATDIIKFYF